MALYTPSSGDTISFIKIVVQMVPTFHCSLFAAFSGIKIVVHLVPTFTTVCLQHFPRIQILRQYCPVSPDGMSTASSGNNCLHSDARCLFPEDAAQTAVKASEPCGQRFYIQPRPSSPCYFNNAGREIRGRLYTFCIASSGLLKA